MNSILFLVSCVLFAYNVMISTKFVSYAYIVPVTVLTFFVQVMFYVKALVNNLRMIERNYKCVCLRKTNKRLYKKLQKCRMQLRKYKQYQNDYENNHFDENNNSYYDYNDNEQYDDENNYYYGNKNNYFDGTESYIGEDNETPLQ